jgi:hypothetical protein
LNLKSATPTVPSENATNTRRLCLDADRAISRSRRSVRGRPGSRFHGAVDGDGVPLRARAGGGNENDQRSLLALVDDYRLVAQLAARLHPLGAPAELYLALLQLACSIILPASSSAHYETTSRHRIESRRIGAKSDDRGSAARTTRRRLASTSTAAAGLAALANAK